MRPLLALQACWGERHRHLYQGRFKSFPIEADEHLYTVLRDVERNALRAGLVRLAEEWRWSSLYRRQHAAAGTTDILQTWPVPVPENWLTLVNEPQTEAELKALRQAVRRNSPFGSAAWQMRTAQE